MRKFTVGDKVKFSTTMFGPKIEYTGVVAKVYSDGNRIAVKVKRGMFTVNEEDLQKV